MRGLRSHGYKMRSLDRPEDSWNEIYEAHKVDLQLYGTSQSHSILIAGRQIVKVVPCPGSL